MVPPLAAFAVNAVCILLLMILGCHNVIMYNHSTFVLGYLLLLGYDVTGKEYTFRVIGLLVGMVICMIVFYKNQRNRAYRRTFLDLFREFDLKSARSRWYDETDTNRIQRNAVYESSGTSQSNVGRNRLYVCMPAFYRGLCPKICEQRNV